MNASTPAPRFLSRSLFRSISTGCRFGLLALALGGAQAAHAAKPYQHFAVGDTTDVALPRPAAPALVLMGGGPDVDQAFKWMIQKGGGGNFVVIRATGTDAYNPYIYAMGGVRSVETFVLPSRAAASDPFVLQRIRGAEAVFIAGGDQSDYIRYWKDTPLEAALQELANRNVPLGGTSAGLAVLGQYIYSGMNQSVTSPQALANPYDKNVTLDRDFLALPVLNRVITDSHLDTRDRMGRLVAFLGRIVNDGWTSSARGIGVDVETALLVEGAQAQRVGLGDVYFLQTVGLPQVCAPKTPLTYQNVGVQRLSGTGSFDLNNWASYGATVNYSISAVKGVLVSNQPGGSAY
ncbi:cyanophycinase [Massilia sp. Dwa41.01b]|uniref:cyanophycinase n=1 Tax=unclassified Massilia TaxID=2609279 RepID=UPI001601AA32|nr:MULTISPECIES: cyanophycinase [unclassified Massilia]QNA90042.1 cyanophycinase [Massilia sp. Dwa41.01b]QNB00932.1 cyanophycinase [Massilia sp. Se16.2.3]